MIITDQQEKRIREIVANLDEIEAIIDKLIFEEDDLDTAVEWMDARTTWSEDLHHIMKEVLDQ